MVSNVGTRYSYPKQMVTLRSNMAPRPTLCSLACFRKKAQGGPGPHNCVTGLSGRNSGRGHASSGQVPWGEPF